MPTEKAPSQASNLNLFAVAIRDAAVNYHDAVTRDKPIANELAKNLKHVKILLALCDYEIKQLRNKK